MQPWMSDIEIETIKKYLKSNFCMLEYGSGGSTLLFPNFVNEYYSIEHNKEWFEKVKLQCDKKVNINYVGMDSVTPPDKRVKVQSWKDLKDSSRAKDYHSYIRYPKKFNTKFDAVLVDGRARPECVEFITDYLKDDGYLFMHDYWPECRKEYRVVEEYYKVIDSVLTGQSLAVLQKK